MNNAPAIELDKLERRLGHFKLGPLSFSVPRGIVLAFIGPNGAGTTTTLDMIMGLCSVVAAGQIGAERAEGAARPVSPAFPARRILRATFKT